MTCVWEADPACLGTAWTNLAEDVQERSLMLATSSLQMLTYNRVGTCPVTIRPCPERRCGCAPGWIGATADAGSGPAFFPHMEADGLWYNSCCSTPCAPVAEVDIPGPVGFISELLVDGVPVPLDDGNWRLDDGHLLVWQGEGISPIPGVQDLNLPDTAPGTWSVTYSKSYPVDDHAKMAVAFLAVEFAKACTPKSKCDLPRGVTSVVRNGVSFTIQAGLFPNGLTGIDIVDAFILKWAPAGAPTVSAVVFDPRQRTARRTSAVPVSGNGSSGGFIDGGTI